MLMNLLLGLPTMILCLLLQALLLAVAIRYYAKHRQRIRSDTAGSSIVVLVGVMILLVIGNLAQVVIWAWLFFWLGEFMQFSDAVYHSAVNFATLGYGDIVMSARNRLLGPIEAINGVLMIGVSTATLMSAIQDALMDSLPFRNRKPGL